MGNCLPLSAFVQRKVNKANNQKGLRFARLADEDSEAALVSYGETIIAPLEAKRNEIQDKLVKIQELIAVAMPNVDQGLLQAKYNVENLLRKEIFLNSELAQMNNVLLSAERTKLVLEGQSRQMFIAIGQQAMVPGRVDAKSEEQFRKAQAAQQALLMQAKQQSMEQLMLDKTILTPASKIAANDPATAQDVDKRLTQLLTSYREQARTSDLASLPSPPLGKNVSSIPPSKRLALLIGEST